MFVDFRLVIKHRGLFCLFGWMVWMVWMVLIDTAEHESLIYNDSKTRVRIIGQWSQEELATYSPVDMGYQRANLTGPRDP